MSANRPNLMLGIPFGIVSAVISPAVMIALSGIAICGGSLKASTVAVSLLLAAGLPTVSGVFLRSWWPLGTLAFSWAQLMILFMIVNLGVTTGSGIEWDRAAALLGSVILAVPSAYYGSRLAAGQNAASNDG